MNYLKISLGIFALLAASRFVSSPAKFYKSIGTEFLCTCIFGIKFLPVLILSFIFTDLFIGLHGTTFFLLGKCNSDWYNF